MSTENAVVHSASHQHPGSAWTCSEGASSAAGCEPHGAGKAQLLVVVVLAATGLMLLVKVVDSSIAYYINPVFSPLAVGAGLMLVLLAAARAPAAIRGAPGHLPVGLGLGLLGLPLAFGVLVPARPLGSGALDTTSANLRTGLVGRAAPSLHADTAAWTLLDWAVARLRDPSLSNYVGRPVSVVGFVHRTANLASDEFDVARFVVVCCSADGTAVTLRVRHANAEALASDSWVRVTGTLSPAGSTAVVVADTVTAVSQPRSPYLYP
jgi:uncharacterized repeat protein (TIGR03943 family)